MHVCTAQDRGNKTIVGEGLRGVGVEKRRSRGKNNQKKAKQTIVMLSIIKIIFLIDPFCFIKQDKV